MLPIGHLLTGVEAASTAAGGLYQTHWAAARMRPGRLCLEPLVSASSLRQVCGVEVLYRPQFPFHGMPSEDSRRWLSWYRHLADRGMAFALDRAPYVTFNLTTRQLADDRIYREIQRLPLHGRIVVEWVETPALPAQLEKATKRLHALRSEGVGVAIDDAGAGHDWMDRATRVRPDWIKIDGALFQAGAAGYRSAADIACRGIVEIARDLGAVVVAEWVENDAHVAYARKIGCRYLQGRYFNGALERQLARIGV